MEGQIFLLLCSVLVCILSMGITFPILNAINWGKGFRRGGSAVKSIYYSCRRLSSLQQPSVTQGIRHPLLISVGKWIQVYHHYVHKAVLKVLEIYLPQPLECWEHIWLFKSYYYAGWWWWYTPLIQHSGGKSKWISEFKASSSSGTARAKGFQMKLCL